MTRAVGRAAKRILEVPEGEHAELGASSSERWLPCPGSVLASRGKPGITSRYAIEGSAAHAVSEWVRRRRVPADFFKGAHIRVRHDNTHTDVLCNTAMVVSVQTFCDAIAKWPGDELIETRVSYDRYVPGGFGTLDGGKLMPRVCRLKDFKHGQGVRKDAKMNSQLMLYGVGVALDYSWLYDRFQTYILAISQPRLNHYDEWEISAKDLAAWANDVARPGAALALTPGAPFKAGPWCRFCRIRDDCRVRAAYLAEQGPATPRRGNDFEAIEE